jgi:hypothetical protein
MRSPVIPREGPGLSSSDKARLLAEILPLYARAGWLLRRVDLPTALARLRGADEPSSPLRPADQRFAGRALGDITTRVLSALPTDGRCLIRSLVLTGLLSRRGIGSTLVLAVHPGQELAAHAWVEHAGAALIEPGRPPLERLAEL